MRNLYFEDVREWVRENTKYDYDVTQEVDLVALYVNALAMEGFNEYATPRPDTPVITVGNPPRYFTNGNLDVIISFFPSFQMLDVVQSSGITISIVYRPIFNDN